MGSGAAVSSEDLAWAREPASKMLLGASVPYHVGLSRELLSYLHILAAGFPQSDISQREKCKDGTRFLLCVILDVAYHHFYHSVFIRRELLGPTPHSRGDELSLTS